MSFSFEKCVTTTNALHAFQRYRDLNTATNVSSYCTQRGQKPICGTPDIQRTCLYFTVISAGAREQGVLRVLQHPCFFCGQL